LTTNRSVQFSGAPKLTHHALHCRDIEATIAFYRDVCGMKVGHDRTGGDIRVVWMTQANDPDGVYFVLIDGGDPAPQRPHDFGHFGFEMPTRADVDIMHAAGVARDCVQWPAKDDGYPVGYNCGLRDPDGKVVEFSYVLEFSDRAKPE
jgi:catechol 2,3-dioxygenase-like lactoylglutathione lyase family enzyme